jgi:hypothetical protein
LVVGSITHGNAVSGRVVSSHVNSTRLIAERIAQAEHGVWDPSAPIITGLVNRTLPVRSKYSKALLNQEPEKMQTG